MNKLTYRLLNTIILLALTFGGYTNVGASAASVSASGNVYYVSPTGNDTNPGTSSAPFKTIQKCANLASLGDTCSVRPGNYPERISISKPYIILKCMASLSCTIIGADITGGNATLDGFYSLNSLSYEGAIFIKSDGNIVRNNTIEGATMAGITIQGNKNLVENNEILGSLQRGTEGSLDADGMRFFKDGNVIRGNYIHDIDPSLNPTSHMDCFQTWDDVVRGHATNTIFENNICILPFAGSQGFMIGSPGSPDGITIRNNIIFAYHGINSIGARNLTVVNNTFVWDVAKFDSLAFYAGNTSNVVFQNNILYNHWSNVVATGIKVKGGGNLAYRSDGLKPRNDSWYDNSKDLWGVNPNFINTTDVASGDYFRLQSNSPACIGGVEGGHIGALACELSIPTNIPATPTVSPTPVLPSPTATKSPTATATAIPFTPTPTPTATATEVPFTPTSSPVPTLPEVTETESPTATSQPTSAPVIPVSNGGNSVDVRVANGNDDVEESLSRGRMYINSSDLELIYDNSAQVVGLRFTGVNIPKGAVITNSYIQFKTGQTSSRTINLTIYGEASGNASAFANIARNVSSRARTSNSVTWTPPTWSKRGEMGTAQRTPNLNAIVQEIVNQPNWNSGNSIVMMVMGKYNNKRVAKSFEGNSAGAPLLHVEFSMPVQAVMALASTPTHTPTPTATATVTVMTPVMSPTFMPTFTAEPTQVLALPTTMATETTLPTEPPAPTPTSIPPTPTVEVVVPTETPTPASSESTVIAPVPQAASKQSVANEHPVITSSGSFSITENTTAVTTVTATDAQTLTYSIIGGADAALFSINTSSGNLAFITAPDFEVPTDAGADNIYNVTVQVSDGELVATQDIVIAITATNDNSPVITSNGNLSIVENTTAVTTITATDVDLPAPVLTYSIAGDADSALFNINTSTGELTFIVAPDFEVPTDADKDNVYNVTVQASDGELAATQDIVVTVTATNDNIPVITSAGNFLIVENTMAVTTVTATDADLPAQALTYSIVGGADSALFSINSSTSELTFIAAPDFEVPADAGADNIYNVTVQASDGELATSQDIIVTVTAANDNTPVITSNGGLSIEENTTAVMVVSATDADQPTQVLTYSIVGGADSILFSISSFTGELTFIKAPDFEVPTDAGADNIYNVTVQASDGELAATQGVVVTVAAANDNTPVITTNDSLLIVENTTAVTTVTATDADLPAQSLTHSIVGGVDSALFSINASTGELTLIVAPDFEVPTDAGMDNIYNVTIQVSDGTFGAKQNIAVAVKGADQLR